MPADRRRAFARVAVAMVATAVVSFAASGTSAQAATNPLSLTIKAGYGGFLKAQQWMPVTIDVTNKGPDVDGTLEVTSAVSTNGPPIGSAVYQTHLALPSGAAKHLRTYVIEDQAPAPVSVRIVQNGKTLASADSSTGSAATVLIGVLSDLPTALDSFSAVHPANIAATVVHLSLPDRDRRLRHRHADRRPTRSADRLRPERRDARAGNRRLMAQDAGWSVINAPSTAGRGYDHARLGRGARQAVGSRGGNWHAHHRFARVAV